jgi:hypothetical protein
MDIPVAAKCLVGGPGKNSEDNLKRALASIVKFDTACQNPAENDFERAHKS